MPKPRKIPAFDFNSYLQKDSDETPFVFGKYRGSTPLEVAETDPSYLVWAYETFTLKPCTKHLYELCKLNTQEKRREAEDDPELRELDGHLNFHK